MRDAPDPIRTRSSTGLCRLLLACFDNCAHQADAERCDGDDGNPGRAEAHQAGPIRQCADHENDADHIDKEVSHTAWQCSPHATYRRVKAPHRDAEAGEGFAETASTLATYGPAPNC